MPAFGVLLVETDGQVVHGIYEYRGERMPAVGDEIEVSGTQLPINMTPGTVRARVTEIAEADEQPIRARELEWRTPAWLQPRPCAGSSPSEARGLA